MADPVNPIAHTPAEAARQQAEASKVRAEAEHKSLLERRAEATKKLDEADKARNDYNIERGKRELGYRPTPTQRESDLARLGLLDIDAKEDDGSGPEIPPFNIRRSAHLEGQHNEPYKTREAKAGK
jgi:hypothetical protein